MDVPRDPAAGDVQELVREIERLRRENSELREWESFLRLSQRIASVGSWSWNFATGKVRWSEEMFTIFGIRPEDFDGTPEGAGKHFHPDDQDRVARAIEDSLAGKPNSEEYRVLRPDGTVRVVWGQGEQTFDTGGTPSGMIGTILDVTERRAVDEALRESERRLRLAQASARMGTWSGSHEGTLQGSRELAELLGFDSSAALDVLRCVHPDDRARVQSSVTEALAQPEQGNVAESEVRMIDAEGREHWMLLKGRAVRGTGGEPHRVAGVAVDVSDRRALERELSQTRRLEGLGRLAGGIAHDFNNLLTAILGSADLAVQDTDDRELVADCLGTIRTAGRRAAELIKQLLSFARHQRIEARAVDVTELVERIRGLIESVLGEQSGFATSIEADVWPALVDPGSLEQVLVNLALNARDAMPNGGELQLVAKNAQVVAGEFESLAAGQYVLLEIADSGVGMSEDVQSRAFEPFFTTKETGTGLGLASVHGIVHQHGGTIQVESTRGSGTLFKLWIPRSESPPDQLDAEPPVEIPAEGTETILLVEDNELLRGELVRELTACGFTVYSAAHGDAALRIQEMCPGEIDALVCDVVLPGVSGPELARQIADREPRLAVVFTSGYGDGRVDGDGLGAPLLVKPFRLGELASTLRRTIDARDRDQPTGEVRDVASRRST